MSDIVVIRCLARVAFFDVKVFAGSYVKVDSNLGIPVRTGGRIGTNVLVFHERSITSGLHVTDFSVILVADGKHWCSSEII